ncbi:MAG: esterase family protein [Bacteroidales bacterium]|nr:esterase family protein [Bacteroidales bacterium]
MKKIARILLPLLLIILPSCSVWNYLVPNSVRKQGLEGFTHVPKGTLVQMSYPVTDGRPDKRQMMVYLPDDYGTGEKRYPVVYLLHGARGNQYSWVIKGQVTKVADEVYSHSGPVKAIIVMPNVNQYNSTGDARIDRPKNALESVLEIDGKVEAEFLHDVVAFVDDHFRTIPDKQHRAIAGLSIGGMQSMYISANNPDVFDYVGLFSPLFGAHIRRSDFSHFYKDIQRKVDMQFENPPAMYMVTVGTTDILHLATKSICHMLDRKKYPYIYMESPGGHDWVNWRRNLYNFLYATFRE